MKREELERRINDAADGMLDVYERRKLEEALKRHPGLMQDYRDIMSLPDLSKAYGKNWDAHRNDLKMYQIKEEIDRAWRQSSSFEEISIVWFRKYALVASLLILAMTSLFYLMEPQFGNEEELTAEEYVYSYEESIADAYVLYLDEWMER